MAKRDIFGELMEGAAAMKSHRERKLTVRTYKVAASRGSEQYQAMNWSMAYS
jgi:hypothetical protein